MSKLRQDSVIPMTPAADQRGKEGYFVEVASGEASVVNAATDVPIGVIVEGCNTDGKSSIAVHGGHCGTVLVKVGSTPGTINIGTYLTVKNDGTVQADAGTGNRVRVARALETGAADELIEAVLINPEVLS